MRTALRLANAIPEPVGRPLYLFGIFVFLVLFVYPVKPWFTQMGMRWLHILLFSFLFASLLVRPVRAFARKMDIVDWPDARKLHAEPIPLLGGAVIYLAFVMSLLTNSILTPALSGLLAGGTLVFVISQIDDIRPLPATLKLGIMLLATLVVIVSGTSLTLFPTQTLWGQALNVVLTILWIVGLTNAMNFFDGMDGLGGGLAAIAAFFLGVIAYQSQQVVLGWVAAALLGSTLGFLPYNFRLGKQATIFLGDAGSTFLGFVLASLAVMGEWAEHDLANIAAPLLIFGVFVYDMIYITVDRVILGKVRSIKQWIDYVGRDHLHHRLEAVLGKREYAVLFTYALSISLSIGATVLLMGSPLSSFLLVDQAVVILLMVTILERKGRRSG